MCAGQRGGRSPWPRVCGDLRAEGLACAGGGLLCCGGARPVMRAARVQEEARREVNMNIVVNVRSPQVSSHAPIRVALPPPPAHLAPTHRPPGADMCPRQLLGLPLSLCPSPCKRVNRPPSRARSWAQCGAASLHAGDADMDEPPSVEEGTSPPLFRRGRAPLCLGGDEPPSV